MLEECPRVLCHSHQQRKRISQRGVVNHLKAQSSYQNRSCDIREMGGEGLVSSLHNLYKRPICSLINAIISKKSLNTFNTQLKHN